MNSKIALVAWREYLENLRTKTFWIGILAFPLLIGISFVVGRLFAKAKDVRTYAVLDLSQDQWLSKAVDERSSVSDLSKLVAPGEKPDPEVAAKLAEQIASLPADHPYKRLFAEFTPTDAIVLARGGERAETRGREILVRWQQSLTRDDIAVMKGLDSGLSFVQYHRVPVGDLGAEPEKALAQRLQKGELFAYIVLGKDPIGDDSGNRYVSNNVSDTGLKDWYQAHATSVVRERRVAAAGLSPEQARAILASFRFADRRIDASGAETEVSKSDRGFAFAPVAFVYLLWIAVFTAAQMLLTNTVEEKSNRIIEVLLSSVSPLQLMAGKVFGIGATGLTVVGSWALCALLGVQVLPTVFPGMAELKLGDIIGSPLFLGSFVGYFLAGYLMYAAVLVGLGAVCNSLKEAQNLLQPVFLLLIVPLIAMIPIVQDPNGTLAKVLTYIPPFTPFVMMNRAGGPPSGLEYLASSLLLIGTILFAFYFAAKIFRVGILMTGKPPSLREILRMLKAPAN